MAITGYTDRMSVEPGENIKFMVNSESGKYQTQVMRLLHGDTHPDSPGFKFENVDADINKEYEGRKQEIHMGSYINVGDVKPLNSLESFSLQAMIFPTFSEKGVDSILSKWNVDKNSGYGLFIDENRCLSFWIGDGSGNIEKITGDAPLTDGYWYLVGASFDMSQNTIRIYQEAYVTKTNGRYSSRYNTDQMTVDKEKTVSMKPLVNNKAPFVIASVLQKDELGKNAPFYSFNGKIDRPRIAKKAATKQECGNRLKVLICIK